MVAFIVDLPVEGFHINAQHGKMGMRATSTAELIFNNCIIESWRRIGAEGEAFGMTMKILDGSRIAVAAQCVGLAQAAYEASLEYVRQRYAFGQHLSKFQSIQWVIADMATNIDAARLLTMRAATLKDKGKEYSREASMAKLFASRVAVEVADKAVQIHGGTGYFAPTVVERLYRDAKLTEIYEGTSEVQRMVISKSLLE
jgi:butyryl-CoA dehydrogenase